GRAWWLGRGRVARGPRSYAGCVPGDGSTDPKTGQSYYTARIRVRETQRERLGEVQVVRGMTVEACLQIGERSVMSYLIKPLADQVAKAWREK
ncbi:hypothetical protein MKK60_12945, partial [Methylobacterium sp. J-092]|nr:hypothetical protein [Methylobacterium sp. J-092]